MPLVWKAKKKGKGRKKGDIRPPTRKERLVEWWSGKVEELKNKTRIAPDAEEEEAYLDAEEKKARALKEKEDADEKRVRDAAATFDEKSMRASMKPLVLHPSLSGCCCRCRGIRKPFEFSGMVASAMRILGVEYNDVAKCKRFYLKLDPLDNNWITHAQLLHALGVQDVQFVRRVLKVAVFDMTTLTNSQTFNEGTLSFEEFFLAACIMCTLSRDQIMYKVFKTFDVDDSNDLDLKELEGLARSIQGITGVQRNFSPGNMATVLETFDRDGSGRIELDEFLQLEIFAPMVFYPLFSFQERLKKATLGHVRWKKLTEAWNRMEKKRAGLLKEAPTPLSDRVQAVLTWDTKRKESKAAEAHAARLKWRKVKAMGPVLAAKQGLKPLGPKPGTAAASAAKKREKDMMRIAALEARRSQPLPEIKRTSPSSKAAFKP